MNLENEKSKAFINRLLGNPALGPLNPLQKETQIIQFLNVNKNQLFPTLSSQNFFPGKNWNEIFSILYISLQEIINTSLFAGIDEYLQKELDLSFITYLRQQNWPGEKIKIQLKEFLTKMLTRNEARREYSGVLSVLNYHFIDKYLEQVFETKSYIYIELTKVQKLKMSVKEIKNMLKLTLLLRPMMYLFIGTSPDSTNMQENSNNVVPPQFADKLLATAKQNLAVLPEEILKSAINSNVSFLDNRFIEATSRISAILASMCKNFRPDIKVDRGAVSPEKSWISIARKNYKFFGYDIKVLDEFYKIAAENNW